jgi:hypothetical protein
VRRKLPPHVWQFINIGLKCQRKIVAIDSGNPAAILAAPGGKFRGEIFMANDSLKTGDWVRAPSGQTGKIILISRLSAFVEVQQEETPRTETYLLSELIRVDPPHER